MLHLFNSHVLILFWCCLSLSLWAATWFKIYCTGQFAPWQQSQPERTETGRNAETEIPFSSPIPPIWSCTLSTQIIQAADCGSTAPLRRDGGGDQLQQRATTALCLQTCGLPPAVLLSDGIWVEGLSDLWLNSLQVFISTKRNSGWFFTLLCLLSGLKCCVWMSCCLGLVQIHFWML